MSYENKVVAVLVLIGEGFKDNEEESYTLTIYLSQSLF